MKTLPSTIEEIEREFLVECEAFTRLNGKDPFDEEGMQILKSFLRSALIRVHKETAEAMEVAEKEKPSEVDDSFYPILVDGHNSAIAAARSGLEAYRGGMEV